MLEQSSNATLLQIAQIKARTMSHVARVCTLTDLMQSSGTEPLSNALEKLMKGAKKYCGLTHLGAICSADVGKHIVAVCLLCITHPPWAGRRQHGQSLSIA